MKKNGNGLFRLTRRGFVKSSLGTAAAGAGMLLAGCGGSGSAGTGSSAAGTGNKVATIAVATAAVNLDPIVAGDSVSMCMISNVVEGLFSIDENDQVQPAQCESYDVSDDQLTYTFHLRDGLKWSNGDPVTAADYVYAWQRNASATGDAAAFQYQIEMASIKNQAAVLAGEAPVTDLGISAPDDKTIVVETENAVPFLLDILAFTPWVPVNQKFCEEKDTNFGLTKDDILYNGPFTLTQYDTAGNTFTMTKNPDYWDAENVDLDEVNFQDIPDTQSAVMAYENGTVDYVQLSGDLVEQYKDNEGFKVGPGIFNYYFMINTKVDGYDSLAFRQAIAYCIDRADICDNILKNGSQPVNQMCMQGLWSNEDGKDFAEDSEQFFDYDPEKAKELWEQAKAETDRREITITYDQEKDFAQNACAYIQSALQNTLDGLTVNIQATPKKNRLQMAYDHNFEILFWGWGPDYSDATAILAMYKSDHPSNYSQWASDDFDTTYDKANTTDAGDASARWEDLKHCNAVCTEQAVCIPIFQEGLATLTQSSLHGKTDHITGIDCFYKYTTKD